MYVYVSVYPIKIEIATIQALYEVFTANGRYLISERFPRF